MQTAVLNRNFQRSGMVNLKFIAYLLNPKVLAALLIIDLSGIMQFITKYIFSDINYLKFLVIACIFDLITGVWKVVVTQGVKAVSSRGLRDTITKVISYGSFLFLIHLITHYEIDGKVNSGLALFWLNKVALEFLILIEIRSIYENIIKINSNLDFIDSALQRIVNMFKNKKDESK